MQDALTEPQKLYNTVIANDYCIGCGNCTLPKGSPFTIKMDKFGNLVAACDVDSLNTNQTKVLALCPFSNSSKNEDELGETFFPKNSVSDGHLGKYISLYAGFANNENIRKIGSSGGVGKWLSQYLLEKNLVDFYVQVTPNTTGKPTDELFKYAVFSNPMEAVNASTSAYYPTTMEGVLKTIQNTPGKYAVTGTPCFVKALRLQALANPILKERIKYTVGIVCGGMKSANQSKMIAWQMGVHPKELTRIDFRGKNYGKTPATTKIYRVWGKDGKEASMNSSDIFGADYGMGLFKPKACDFCDDVVGETSDISIGDVWIPPYRFDKKGYSLIIIRNPELDSLFKEEKDKGTLVLEALSREQAVATQSGGFRHRRDGLSERLLEKEKQQVWYPKKRILPGQIKVDSKRRKLYAYRSKLSLISHQLFVNALVKNEYSAFPDSIAPYFKRYRTLNEGNLFVRLQKKVNRRLKLILKS